MHSGSWVLACFAWLCLDVFELDASAAVEERLLYTAAMKMAGGTLASLARGFGPPWLLLYSSRCAHHQSGLAIAQTGYAYQYTAPYALPRAHCYAVATACHRRFLFSVLHHIYAVNAVHRVLGWRSDLYWWKSVRFLARFCGGFCTVHRAVSIQGRAATSFSFSSSSICSKHCSQF